MIIIGAHAARCMRMIFTGAHAERCMSMIITRAPAARRMSRLMRKWTLASNGLTSFTSPFAVTQKGQRCGSLSEASFSSIYYVSKQRTLWRECADAMTRLSLAAHLHNKYHIHMSRLVWFIPFYIWDGVCYSSKRYNASKATIVVFGCMWSCNQSICFKSKRTLYGWQQLLTLYIQYALVYHLVYIVTRGAGPGGKKKGWREREEREREIGENGREREKRANRRRRKGGGRKGVR